MTKTKETRMEGKIQKNRKIKKMVIGAVIIIILFINPTSLYAYGINSLKATLLANDFSPKFINQVDKHFVPRHVVLRKNFYHKETNAQYKHYTSASSIKRLTNFYKLHRALFINAGKKGVNGTIIAAILFIETNFGKQTGGYGVSNVYANIIAFSDSKNQAQKRKMNWAIKQMRALQTIWKNGKVDIFALKGSWAGAFGIPQFIPSSYITYAVDGNGDGKINLYNLADAAASVSNFLMKEGWNGKNKLKIILHYNRSIYYGQTVIKLSNILKK